MRIQFCKSKKLKQFKQNRSSYLTLCPRKREIKLPKSVKYSFSSPYLFSMTEECHLIWETFSVTLAQAFKTANNASSPFRA